MVEGGTMPNAMLNAIWCTAVDALVIPVLGGVLEAILGEESVIMGCTQQTTLNIRQGQIGAL